MANQSNNVFMIGWEYPPSNSGGLGVACEGLTKALSQEETKIHFSLPYKSKHQVNHMDVHYCVHKNWQKNNSSALKFDVPPFYAYSSELPSSWISDNSGYSFDLSKLRKLSSSQLEKQVTEYAEVVAELGGQKQLNFDVIHAHDWMSFPAGQELKKQTGKPLVVHVHSTEYDRAGLSRGNQYITSIEYMGMHQADHVITVSYYTKRLLEQKYGVDPRKVSVVHNGVDNSATNLVAHNRTQFAPKRPVIVFMGRLTIQKGVSYFLDLAKEVLSSIPEALFIVAGSGDMYQQLLIKTASDGLSASVVFSGFVRAEQKKKLLSRADVFVMPSVSEPFGLVALEAAQHHTPVIVSKNAGVSEVLSHAVRVDFWDIKKMAQVITDLVTNQSLATTQVKGQLDDLAKQTWKVSAHKVKQIYHKVLRGLGK